MRCIDPFENGVLLMELLLPFRLGHMIQFGVGTLILAVVSLGFMFRVLSSDQMWRFCGCLCAFYRSRSSVHRYGVWMAPTARYEAVAVCDARSPWGSL